MSVLIPASPADCCHVCGFVAPPAAEVCADCGARLAPVLRGTAIGGWLAGMWAAEGGLRSLEDAQDQQLRALQSRRDAIVALLRAAGHSPTAAALRDADAAIGGLMGVANRLRAEVGRQRRAATLDGMRQIAGAWLNAPAPTQAAVVGQRPGVTLRWQQTGQFTGALLSGSGRWAVLEERGLIAIDLDEREPRRFVAGRVHQARFSLGERHLLLSGRAWNLPVGAWSERPAEWLAAPWHPAAGLALPAEASVLSPDGCWWVRVDAGGVQLECALTGEQRRVAGVTGDGRVAVSAFGRSVVFLGDAGARVYWVDAPPALAWDAWRVVHIAAQEPALVSLLLPAAARILHHLQARLDAVGAKPSPEFWTALRTHVAHLSHASGRLASLLGAAGLESSDAVAYLSSVPQRAIDAALDAVASVLATVLERDDAGAAIGTLNEMDAQLVWLSGLPGGADRAAAMRAAIPALSRAALGLDGAAAVQSLMGGRAVRGDVRSPPTLSPWLAGDDPEGDALAELQRATRDLVAQVRALGE